MKTISALLALFALAFADAALASAAVVTSATGTVQVQVGTAPSRVVRLGDQVNQGETVSTGPASSVVLKFYDGQVAALTANSRMTVSSYQYNPSAGTGNVLLSLLTGGMRAITGLIGKNQPSQVSYRAATATIGIRGTDVTIATDGGDVVVSVKEGSIEITFNGVKTIVTAGEAVTIVKGRSTLIKVDQLFNQLPANLRNAIGGIDSLATAIATSAPGVPISGVAGGGGGGGTGGILGGPNLNGGGTGGGGGNSSVSPSGRPPG